MIGKSKYNIKTGFLKFKILSQGLTINEEIKKNLGRSIKDTISLRSGLSSGIDIILPENIWVNAPINEWFAKESSLFLESRKSKFALVRNGKKLANITILPRPAYYDKITSDGIPMKKIGTMRGDRISIGINNYCIFWDNRRMRCKFCAIGINQNGEQLVKSPSQIIETIVAAINDPILSAKHVYLNSGAQPGLDSGFMEFSNIIQEIKNNFNIHVHLNPCPPKSKKYIDILYNAGLDEISFNLEIFDRKTAKKIIPGKYKIITQETTLKMLKYAVEIFGKGKVSSCLVVGLEDPNNTIKGVDLLASCGVIPKLSCFRPTRGSILENLHPPPLKTIVYIYNKAREVTDDNNIPLGPLCIPCQLHSLVLPTNRKDYFFF